MIDNTAELALKLPEPAVSAAEIEQLVAVLRELSRRPTDPDRKPGWFTAAEIATEMGDDATDRHVRKLASAACPAVVSFPGSPGYKLWQLCSVDEIDHCIAAFESQGRDMMKRGILYRPAYHRRFRGAPSR